MEKIGFGGGCHWCTEGIFQALRGVVDVEQGFIQSEAPSDAWAEGVIVNFDPALVSLGTLAEVHLRTHAAKGSYSPEERYRSAIYVFEASQCPEAARTIAQYSLENGEATRTLVLSFVGFKSSEARYRDYYRTDPNRPFCRRYIDPKLDYIRKNFAEFIRTDVADPYP